MKQTGMENSNTVERFEILDGLRGIAALWIVIFHLLLTGTNVGQYGPGTLTFLVLSGFASCRSTS